MTTTSRVTSKPGTDRGWGPTWTSSNPYLGGVQGILAAQGRVYLYGQFDTFNGQLRQGIVAVDGETADIGLHKGGYLFIVPPAGRAAAGPGRSGHGRGRFLPGPG